MKMMKPATFKTPILLIIAVFLIMSSLTSCDPIRRATNRHERLVHKFPHVHKNDTIILHDTIRIQIPKTEFDTVFLTSMLRDTITITKDRLKIKMYTVHDSIYLNAECDTITIEKIIERKIPIKYYEAKPKWMDWLKWILIGSFILALIFLITKIFKNGSNSQNLKI